MSLLTVTNVSHGFGARQILENASFRLLKGEHIGLVGANGEGKSTFLNIITGKIKPDEGNIAWSRHVSVGYLDQHSVLEKGMSIRQVLRGAFDNMYALEKEMLKLYDKMSEAGEEELDLMMEEAGEIQQILETGGFYQLDSKIEEVAGGLGLSAIGLDKDVSELSGGQRTKVLLVKLLLENPSILILDEPTNYLDHPHILWLTRFLSEYENAHLSLYPMIWNFSIQWSMSYIIWTEAISPDIPVIMKISNGCTRSRSPRSRGLMSASRQRSKGLRIL